MGKHTQKRDAFLAGRHFEPLLRSGAADEPGTETPLFGDAI